MSEFFSASRKMSWAAVFVLSCASLLPLTAQMSAQSNRDSGRDNAPDRSRAIEMEESRAQRAAEDLVSLSPDVILNLLRKEPGLLLQVKRALVRAAYQQGRLLDPQDLDDDAVFRLVREDQNVRLVVTHELEDRYYIQAKPRREDLENGLVLKTPTSPEKGATADNQTLKAHNQEEDFWSKHELTLEHYPEPQPYPAQAGGAAPTQPGPGNQLEQNPPQQFSRSRSQAGSDNRDFDSPDGESPDDGATPLPRILPDELPRLLTSSMSDKGFNAPGRTMPSLGGNSIDGNSSDLNGLLASAPRMGAESSGDVPDNMRNQNFSGSRAGISSPHYPTYRPKEIRADQRGLHHRPNPYAEVPSLYDLYSQYSAKPGALQRFGLDIFTNGTGNSENLPMDMPVGPEYVLGPGDGLSIDLWGGVSQRLKRVVDRQGRVSLPEVGAVEVAGKNLGDVQHLVQGVLRTQFRDVEADVSLSRLRAVRVYVVGDVQRPGAYDVSSLSTPLNAVYEAGGPTSRGSLRVLRHYRGKQLLQEIDVYDLLLHGVRSDLQGLQPGDTVLVPPLGGEVTVEGMVRRPAIYELHGENSLAAVLELAGGVLQSGTLRHVDVERVEAHLSRSMLRLDIPEDNKQEAVTKALEEFAVQDGDRIKISPILPYADKAVYLEGHVFRPGKFAYRDGMKITDVLTSYNDLLPEPYKRHAELIRLSAPDYTPVILAFNLDDALQGKLPDLVLKPFDTIRVFGRFDFEDPPVVTVSGEVRDPGDHLTNGATRLRDAIYLAGGATPEAQLNDAQIFRRTDDGKLKIISVNLTSALAGDEASNVLLLPKDRVFIHKNLGKADPATVKVEGEVERPGKYPLGEEMTAVDLVRVAGGLKRGAYTEVADLTRYELENGSNVTGEHITVPIGRALAGDPDTDTRLHDGDVLTIRQLAGWNDVGATITVKGEVVHPGTYGIKAGERLSSVIARAGGFLSDAYPYGAVFERVQVRSLEEQNRTLLLREIHDDGVALKSAPENEPSDKEVKSASLLQWQRTIEEIESTPPTGRLVIHISTESKHWANTAADLEVRAGDVVSIPKRPSIVMVNGAVYNPTAVTYKPGRSAGWYLNQSGGPTAMANKKSIFVIRADGSVAGGSGGMFTGGVESAQLRPGDMVVVPEKAFAGSSKWKNTLQTAQVVESLAIAVSVARAF
jgi:protein involved in polysaccharide export with SLBB domain